jgi:hypothetical protein
MVRPILDHAQKRNLPMRTVELVPELQEEHSHFATRMMRADYDQTIVRESEILLRGRSKALKCQGKLWRD